MTTWISLACYYLFISDLVRNQYFVEALETACWVFYLFQAWLLTKNKANRCFGPLAQAQSHQRHEWCTRIYRSLVTERNSNLDTSHSWSRTETVTHGSTNIAHCCLTSVSRQILITLCHNSRKSDARMTYVWDKPKGHVSF